MFIIYNHNILVLTLLLIPIIKGGIRVGRGALEERLLFLVDEVGFEDELIIERARLVVCGVHISINSSYLGNLISNSNVARNASSILIAKCSRSYLDEVLLSTIRNVSTL
jgi:hypothetical protein